MNFYKIDFGVFSLKFFGIFLGIALIVAGWHFYRQLEKEKLSTDFLVHHFWRWLVAAIFLGRVLAILADAEILTRNGVLSFFAFWDGKINFWGAAVGFFGAAFWDFRKAPEKLKKWLDLAVPSFLIGLILVNFAQFLTGSVYGQKTDLFWGVQYETFGVDLLFPLHPVPIYAAIFHIWLFFFARARARLWTEKFPGRLFFRTAIFFFAADAVLQFLRGERSIFDFGFVRGEVFLDLIAIIILIFAARKIGANKV